MNAVDGVDGVVERGSSLPRLQKYLQPGHGTVAVDGENEPGAQPTRTRVTVITSGHSSPLAARATELDIYDIDRLDPECRLLLIGMHADQLHLERNRDTIDGFLARGGTLVIGGGHILREFFTGAPRWRVAPSTHQRDLGIHRVTAHPVWEGISMDELSIRRGVAGFYGRGGYPDLHEGDIVINRVQEMPIDVELRRGGGRVLVHGGNDLWGFGTRDDPAHGILPQLLRWGQEDGE